MAPSEVSTEQVSSTPVWLERGAPVSAGGSTSGAIGCLRRRALTAGRGFLRPEHPDMHPADEGFQRPHGDPRRRVQWDHRKPGHQRPRRHSRELGVLATVDRTPSLSSPVPEPGPNGDQGRGTQFFLPGCRRPGAARVPLAVPRSNRSGEGRRRRCSHRRDQALCRGAVPSRRQRSTSGGAEGRRASAWRAGEDADMSALGPTFGPNAGAGRARCSAGSCCRSGRDGRRRSSGGGRPPDTPVARRGRHPPRCAERGRGRCSGRSTRRR